jgi:hypothetical protein
VTTIRLRASSGEGVSLGVALAFATLNAAAVVVGRVPFDFVSLASL